MRKESEFNMACDTVNVHTLIVRVTSSLTCLGNQNWPLPRNKDRIQTNRRICKRHARKPRAEKFRQLTELVVCAKYDTE